MLYSASLLVVSSVALHGARAQVTVYGQQGVLSIISGHFPTTTSTPDPTSVFDPYPPTYTGFAAFNPIVLAPPPLPTPAPPTQFPMIVPNSAQNMPGLSLSHSGDFLGFSIEMSVITSIGE